LRLHHHFLPVHDAVCPGELGALRGVLLEFDVGAIGILAPALPGPVAAEFFRGDGDAVPDQRFAQGVDIRDLETEMLDALAFYFGGGIGRKDFDELAGSDLQVKAEQFAVLVEIKVPFEAEGVAVKSAAAFEVGGKDTEVREGFDHGW